MKLPAIFATTFLAATLAAPFARAETPAPAPAGSSSLPTVNHLVYLQTLPTPSSLVQEAKTQGRTIARIDRTDDSVVVTYKTADGRTDVTGYTTLDAASTDENPNVATGTPPPAPRSTTTVVTQPAPQVVYVQPPPPPAPVYYETRYRYYNDPFDNFGAPLTLGVGIGWATGGFGHYHYHGGYRSGRHGWRRH